MFSNVAVLLTGSAVVLVLFLVVLAMVGVPLIAKRKRQQREISRIKQEADDYAYEYGWLDKSK